jgi:AcrR family transcriptional regulator
VSRTKKHQKTREEILDSAWDLISRNGADASIAEIAVSAGISRQSVYLHFGTRGGLLVALVRRADERFSIKDDLFRAMETPNPRARLSAVISVWLEFVPRIYPVAKDLIRLRATDKDAFCAWEDRMGELKLWLTQLTRSLMADGALADGWTASDASDYLWAGSSVQMWGLLVEECGWAPDRAAHKIRAALVHELMDAPCPDGPT